MFVTLAHARLRPLPIGTHNRGVEFSSARLESIPRSFIRLTRFGLLEKEADFAARQGWQRVDLDAFHFAMLSAPDLLAAALLTFARECASMPAPR